jgi:hypothetical protein
MQSPLPTRGVEVTGAHTTIELEERLYRLGNFLAPPDVIGQARLANRSDADLLNRWFDQFHVEAFGFVSDLVSCARNSLKI